MAWLSHNKKFLHSGSMKFTHTKLHFLLVFYGEVHIQSEMENHFPVLSS